MECEVHIASACGIFGCITKMEEGAGLKAGPLTHTFLILLVTFHRRVNHPPGVQCIYSHYDLGLSLFHIEE